MLSTKIEGEGESDINNRMTAVQVFSNFSGQSTRAAYHFARLVLTYGMQQDLVNAKIFPAVLDVNIAAKTALEYAQNNNKYTEKAKALLDENFKPAGYVPSHDDPRGDVRPG